MRKRLKAALTSTALAVGAAVPLVTATPAHADGGCVYGLHLPYGVTINSLCTFRWGAAGSPYGSFASAHSDVSSNGSTDVRIYVAVYGYTYASGTGDNLTNSYHLWPGQRIGQADSNGGILMSQGRQYRAHLWETESGQFIGEAWGPAIIG